MKNNMLPWLYCTTLMSIFYLPILQGETTEVVLSNAMKCTKEELMTFFPQQVVQSVLTHSNMTKEQATDIAQELSQKDKELAKIVEEKADKLEPNPFKDLSQRDLAIRIYRETLYEIFAKVLKSHGITNEDQIQTLLDEIQMAKSKLFIECIRKQQTPLSSPS
jgi:hypothetical protein